MIVVVAGLLLQIATEAIRMMHTQLQVEMGQRIVYNLRARLLAHLQALPLRHHILTRTADSVYRLDADAHCVDDLVIGGVFPLALALLNLGVMFAVLAYLDRTLALLSLTVVPFLYLCSAPLLGDHDGPGRASEGAGVHAHRTGLRDSVLGRRGQELRTRAARAGAVLAIGERDDGRAPQSHVAGVAVLRRGERHYAGRARRSCWSWADFTSSTAG